MESYLHHASHTLNKEVVDRASVSVRNALAKQYQLSCCQLAVLLTLVWFKKLQFSDSRFTILYRLQILVVDGN